MPQIRPLSAHVQASGQMQPQDMVRLAGHGFSLIINNRPDNEEPGQPSSAEVEAAARAAGLDYLHAPVRGMPDGSTAHAVAEVFKSHIAKGGLIAMFCRSGMRSAAVWAMAQRLDGADPEDMRRAAANAGYDLSWLPL